MKKLTYLIDNLLLGFVPNLVVSPLAAYISAFVERGKTVKAIALEARVDVEMAREAIEELQNRTFTVILDKDLVDYSDISFIRSTSSFRYEMNV